MTILQCAQKPAINWFNLLNSPTHYQRKLLSNIEWSNSRRWAWVKD